MNIFTANDFDRYKMATALQERAALLTRRCVIEVDFDDWNQMFIFTAKYSNAGAAHSYSIGTIENLTEGKLQGIITELTRELGRELFTQY